MEAGGPIFHELFDEFMLWSVIVGVITFAWLFHHSLRYRSKDGSNNNVDDFTPGVFPKENGSLTMELTWTFVPFVIIVYLAFISWAPLDEMWTLDEDAHDVGVTGYQWFWEFDCGDLDQDVCSTGYADVEGKTNPVLSLKAGESYTFIINSDDVTHAPFFNDWGLKEDAQPGLETRMSYTPSEDEIGRQLMMCTEYCGDNHGYMTAIIEVHA
jgi:cytochrome c oxidase subunit 2